MIAAAWRSALVMSIAATASCSLLSIDELQEGTSAATTTTSSTATVTNGPGPGAGNSGTGANGSGGDANGNGGTGGGQGGGTTDVSAGSSGAGGDGGSPPGPCSEPSTYADLVFALNPIAYFRMGPDADSLVTDASSDPHDATPQGLLDTVESPLGFLGGCGMTARTLKDAPAALSWAPPDPFVFGEDGAFSLEMWFAVDELPSAGDARFLFARSYEDGSRFELFVTAGGAVYWFFDVGGFRQIGDDSAGVIPGALHHVVAVRAGPPGTVDDDIHLYVDGRITHGPNTVANGELDATDTSPITMPGISYSEPADGSFDEIAIYDRVLTQDQVRSHFCAIVDDIGICP